MSQQIIIRSVEQLQSLKSPQVRRDIARVQLELHAYRRELRAAERAINRALRIQGYAMAALFFGIGALAAVLALLILRAQSVATSPVVMQLPGGWGGALGLLAVVLVLLALIGRYVGLRMAQLRIRRAVDRLVAHALWPQPQTQVPASPATAPGGAAG